MTTFTDEQGTEWQIDYCGCLQVLRQWAQAKSREMSLRVTNESGGMQEIHFDASKFRRFRERFYDEQGAAFSARVVADGRDGVRMLAAKWQEIPQLEAQAQAQFRRVNSHNMQQVTENVEFGQNMVTGLRLVRDVSGIIFMCCIPVAAAAGSLSASGALAARFAGSVFQGVGTWEDTGSAIAGLASANFAFTASLMSLPPTASRTAQVVFSLHNTANTVVRNAALSYITPGSNTRPFTETLRTQLIQELGGQAAERILGDIGGKLATAVLPVMIEAGAGGGSSGGRADADLLPRLPSGQLISELPSGLRATAMQNWLEERRRIRSQQAAEQAWTQTPFYRFMASGDQRDLMTGSQQFINDNLLRPT